MPELPEVEAVCTKLRENILGARITGVHPVRSAVSSPQSPDTLRAAEGSTIVGVERRAKNILLHTSGGQAFRVHLRMTGNLYAIPDHRLRPHTTRLYLSLQDGRGIVLDDPRALGRVTLHSKEELDALLAGCGVEPLSPEFTRERFEAMARPSKLPAKPFLMDQRYVAGLGNIWAAESLFAARIDPRRPMNQLTTRQLGVLHRSIVTVLTGAVQSALAVYTAPSQFPEAELLDLSVYGRKSESCKRCRATIARIVQGGRSTYFCPRCQK